MGTACAIYLIVACSGYATYGSLVNSNILLNYPSKSFAWNRIRIRFSFVIFVHLSSDNSLTSVTRVFISLLVAFSYPLQCLPARTSMMALWHRLDDPDQELDSNVIRFRYIVCTVGVFALVIYFYLFWAYIFINCPSRPSI